MECGLPRSLFFIFNIAFFKGMDISKTVLRNKVLLLAAPLCYDGVFCHFTDESNNGCEWLKENILKKLHALSGFAV